MLIDWFTVAAQGVNFLVLMWLLKRFLYKPILKAIDDREAHIAATVKAAESEKAAAGRELDSLRLKNEAFEFERAQLLSQARDEAKEAGKALLEKERRAADDARDKWHASLAAEENRFGEEVAGRVREEVLSILRRALADLADATLEERMVAVLARRLRGPGERMAAPSALVVKTAFELPEERRAALAGVLAESFGAAPGIRFQTDPGLIGGIELVADGRKIAWSIDDYLDRLEESVSGLAAGRQGGSGDDIGA